MGALRYLLDTNIVIGILKGSEPARSLLIAHGAAIDACAVSQISRIEQLSYPSLTADEDAQIRGLLSVLEVILLDERVEHDTITLRRQLRLKLPDAVILATAKVNGLTLLTLDRQLAAALSPDG